MNGVVVVLEDIANGCESYELICTFTWNYAFIYEPLKGKVGVSLSSRHKCIYGIAAWRSVNRTNVESHSY